jgi:tetratricopeptide (TPR) repeat protein
MRILAAIAGLAGFFLAWSAQAQPSASTADTRSAYDAAFQETLRRPSDPATLVRYAELAVKVGDLEGAITALERLLLIEGDQPRLRLELGILYYKLGSYEVARRYLDGAQNSTRATPEIRNRAAQVIGEVDRKHGLSRFSGDILAGLRYSSNANSGPAGAISAFGAPFVPNPAISRRSDFNAIAAAALRHRYDLGRQDSGTLETDLGLYSARQFQVSEANVHVVDITTGPRVQPFASDLSGLSLKPFLTARYVSVHDLTTYWAWGAGVEATKSFGDRFLTSLTLLGRHREFLNNSDAPFNNRSSGNEQTGYFNLRAILTPGLLLTVGPNVTRFTAVTDPESYWEYGFGGALSARFSDPIGMNGRAWTLTATAGVQFADYDQPNTLIDANIARRQTDLNLGLLLAVPLDESLTLMAQTGYTQRTASLNNYAYDAFSALLAISWRF